MRRKLTQEFLLLEMNRFVQRDKSGGFFAQKLEVFYLFSLRFLRIKYQAV